jgi:hypothetical protein
MTLRARKNINLPRPPSRQRWNKVPVRSEISKPRMMEGSVMEDRYRMNGFRKLTRGLRDCKRVDPVLIFQKINEAHKFT